MLDPFPPPPAWLRDFVEPWALHYNVPALTEHAHEVIIAFAGYLFIHFILSPVLSPVLFPNHYPKLKPRTKLNWDVHVVSLVQSTFINGMALWVMFADEDRASMNASERIYGYTGACGLVSAFAAGYFVYDLIVSTIYVKLFGIGMLFHGISALWVFSFGFRPFVNFYSPVFILYELSSPFLNIHWFLDKVNMTGSNLQWYNGMMLLFTFFSCRLLWGTYQSVAVYRDMWYALKQTWDATAAATPLEPVDITSQVFQVRGGSGSEMAKYASFTAGGVPTWLVLTYVISNVVLNFLNYFWFSKMVETVLKRFRGPAEKSGPAGKPSKEEQISHLKEEITQKVVLEAASKLEQEEGSPFLDGVSEEKVASAVDSGLTEELRKRKVQLSS
ncbi:hypothetical protein AnigIFM63604_003849 [Aspergillus niger]|uniref:DUF887-domain-containing protein n=2 Tax=Aspergillus TaxID=5052 RepID=A0A370PLH4_ASPPH|nr:hypothetical protein CBS147346_10594 [Aspergillus niger]RDK43037.1 DUF887-domain-containing protein [Aspergillus phoenicis ATCC 13157]GLA29419.1 hypothetical protein AnigIFM63326_007323 [Aspergillus niger]GLA48361.1 hypothetical protein AnigIFM63604_003849 [Aspergillus niger]